MLSYSIIHICVCVCACEYLSVYMFIYLFRIQSYKIWIFKQCLLKTPVEICFHIFPLFSCNIIDLWFQYGRRKNCPYIFIFDHHWSFSGTWNENVIILKFQKILIYFIFITLDVRKNINSIQILNMMMIISCYKICWWLSLVKVFAVFTQFKPRFYYLRIIIVCINRFHNYGLNYLQYFCNVYRHIFV